MRLFRFLLSVDHRFYNVYAQTMARTLFYAASGEEDLESTIALPFVGAALVGDYDLGVVQPPTIGVGGNEAGDGETEKFYAFDWGSAHFTVLRSGFFNDPTVDSPGELDSPFALSPVQRDFLMADLAATRKFWKVVVLHHPPFTSKTSDRDGNGLEDYLEFLLDLEAGFGGFEALGVDLVICAHHGFYEETNAVVANLAGVPTVVDPTPGATFSSIRKTVFPPFRRADANQDGVVDVSDASFIIDGLFVGTGKPSPHCKDAADGNDDGEIDISDAVLIVNFLFSGGLPPPLPGPGPGCGQDPTADTLTCLEYLAQCP